MSTGTNPPGYVYKTAFRLARRHWQRPPSDPLPVDVPLRGDVGEEAVTRVATERVLAAMPSRRRTCAVMCFVVGLSTKEAARSLGIAEGTVRKQLELAAQPRGGSRRAPLSRAVAPNRPSETALADMLSGAVRVLGQCVMNVGGGPRF